MQYLSFKELCKIIERKEKEKENELLNRTYLMTICNALTGISYLEFKANVENEMSELVLTSKSQFNSEEYEKKIEHYIDDFKWEEV